MDWWKIIVTNAIPWRLEPDAKRLLTKVQDLPLQKHSPTFIKPIITNFNAYLLIFIHFSQNVKKFNRKMDEVVSELCVFRKLDKRKKKDMIYLAFLKLYIL